MLRVEASLPTPAPRPETKLPEKDEVKLGSLFSPQRAFQTGKPPHLRTRVRGHSPANSSGDTKDSWGEGDPERHSRPSDLGRVWRDPRGSAPEGRKKGLGRGRVSQRK